MVYGSSMIRLDGIVFLSFSHHVLVAFSILFDYSGKFDNGGRFDLRLPYADQGYVDEDADVMGKLGNFFGGGASKKKAAAAEKKVPPKKEPKKKQGGWPW
jgi:hypothetical protein